MSKGDEYRQMAEDLRTRNRHADADVLESLAHEADRLDRLQLADTQTTDEEGDPPQMAMTSAGLAWMLPGIAPPPRTLDVQTQQLTLI